MASGVSPLRKVTATFAAAAATISAGGSLIFFSAQVYTGVFLKTVVKLPAAQASTLVMISTLALLPATIFCGWLSDRIGRRPVLLAGLIGGALTILPVFHGLSFYGSQPEPNTTMIVALLLVVGAVAAVGGRDRLELFRWRDPLPFFGETLRRLL